METFSFVDYDFCLTALHSQEKMCRGLDTVTEYQII